MAAWRRFSPGRRRMLEADGTRGDQDVRNRFDPQGTTERGTTGAFSLLDRLGDSYDRLHAWYRTSKGRSSLQIVYLVLGVALGAYALLSQSWFAGAFAVASLASMYKPS